MTCIVRIEEMNARIQREKDKIFRFVQNYAAHDATNTLQMLRLFQKMKAVK